MEQMVQQAQQVLQEKMVYQVVVVYTVMLEMEDMELEEAVVEKPGK